MTNNFYHEIIKNLHVGYAYHRIICNAQGVPVDFEYIEVNKAFETATGLIGDTIIEGQLLKFYLTLKFQSLIGSVSMAILPFIMVQAKSSSIQNR